MRDDGTPVSVMMSGVSEGFFDVLGLPMTAGRSFTREEHVPAGRDAPFLARHLGRGVGAVCSDRDPAIVGKAIRIAELPVSITVVGVASPLADLPHDVDFWFNGRNSPTGCGARHQRRRAAEAGRHHRSVACRSATPR